MQRLLDLSEDQLQDMMLMRTLYITKRHLLSVRREELVARTRERMPHPIENVTRMSDLASQLKENASEDHQLLYMMSRAFFCGVSAGSMCKDAKWCTVLHCIADQVCCYVQLLSGHKGFSSMHCLSQSLAVNIWPGSNAPV